MTTSRAQSGGVISPSWCRCGRISDTSRRAATAGRLGPRRCGARRQWGNATSSDSSRLPVRYRQGAAYRKAET
jgi:hypothetical protein